MHHRYFLLRIDSRLMEWSLLRKTATPNTQW